MADENSAYAPGTYTQQNGNLSPLQLAVAYYMAQGGQSPFSVNSEFLTQLKIFASSGIFTPQQVNPSIPGLALIAKEDAIYSYGELPDCGPDATDRYGLTYLGTRNQIAPGSWSFDGITVRGGSALTTGGGGPYGTGGLTSPDPSPNNSENRSPNLVPNLSVYASNVSAQTSGIA